MKHPGAGGEKRQRPGDKSGYWKGFSKAAKRMTQPQSANEPLLGLNMR